MIVDLAPDDDANPGPLVAAGGTIFFSATTAELGRELWSYEPGEAPAPVRDITPGPDSSRVDDVTALPGGRVVFTANQSVWVE